MSTDYRALADALAADIAAGSLRPGDRLPPQREFADRRGIATSTASRVYGELIRRGLATGEVGRGTYVRTSPPPSHPALTEPGGARIDLELNAPILPGLAARLARAVATLARRTPAFGAALHPVAAAGSDATRQVAAAFLARGGWAPHAASIRFAGSGKQAIAATIAALVPPGERLGVDALTYPVVKGLAARLGVDLVALAIDDRGVRPDAVAAAQRKTPMRAIYCQPTLHNPLGMTLSGRRRAELAALLRQHDLFAIEDAIYAFLAGDVPPFAALAPDRTVVVDSLSKRVAPGLNLGLIVVPDALAATVGSAIRSGAWGPSGFALDICTRWMADGTATAIAVAKRRDAIARQRLVDKALQGLSLRRDPRAYHAWLTLPEPWRADTFVTAAAREGIAITPASAFAVGPGHAPNAVRLALGSPPPDVLAGALRTLAALVRSGPRGWRTE